MSAVIRVGIDGKCLLPPRQGVARYLEGVVAGCAALPHPDLALDVLCPPAPRRTLPWVLWDMQRATSRYDVVHFPFYYPPLAPRCPTTVALHDVLVIEHPEWFPGHWGSSLRWLVPAGARRASVVVTDSRAVAERIEALCRVPASRIRVIPCGVDRSRFAPPDDRRRAAVPARLGLGRPYLLQLGAIEPRRGIDLAVKAASALRRRWPELELVLVGDVRRWPGGLDHPPDWVRRLGRVDDGDLPPLLAGAAAVVAASRGEGFDLPLLEALACGGVVVASDIPVHVEHFSPAVELFASGEADALEAALERVLGDGARAAQLRAAGLDLAASFSWQASAREHLQLWREVARA